MNLIHNKSSPAFFCTAFVIGYRTCSPPLFSYDSVWSKVPPTASQGFSVLLFSPISFPQKALERDLHFFFDIALTLRSIIMGLFGFTTSHNTL